MKSLIIISTLFVSHLSFAQTWSLRCEDARNNQVQKFYPIFEYSYSRAQSRGILWKEDLKVFENQNRTSRQSQKYRVGIEVGQPMWIDNMFMVFAEFGINGTPAGENRIAIRTRGPGIGNSEIIVQATNTNEFRYPLNRFEGYSCSLRTSQ